MTAPARLDARHVPAVVVNGTPRYAAVHESSVRKSGCTASQIWRRACQVTGQLRAAQPGAHLLLGVQLRIWLPSKARKRDALAHHRASGRLHELHARVRLVRRAQHHGLRHHASHGRRLQVAQAHNEGALQLLGCHKLDEAAHDGARPGLVPEVDALDVQVLGPGMALDLRADALRCSGQLESPGGKLASKRAPSEPGRL